MSKKDISWKIDRLGALIEIDKSVLIVANEWAQLATNSNADLEIPLNPNDPSKPLVIFILLDGRKYVIGYFEERKYINIHLDFDEAAISESREISYEVNNFYESVQRLLTTYLLESVTGIKIGVEMVDYIEKPADGIKKLRNDFSYFSGIDENVSEIELKLKSKLITEDKNEINKIIEFSNKSKLKIIVESDGQGGSTTEMITANIELNIVDNDRQLVNTVDHLNILKKSLLNIVKKELCYESNIEE